MNHTHAPHRMRSAIAPVISAGVITANVIWNATNTSVGIDPVALVRHAVQPEVIEVADNPAVPGAAERQAVSEEHPENRDDSHCKEVLHQHCEHVLRADHAAVEQRQSRCHEQHQGRGGQHPRGISRVDFRHNPLLTNRAAHERARRVMGPRSARNARAGLRTVRERVWEGRVGLRDRAGLAASCVALGVGRRTRACRPGRARRTRAWRPRRSDGLPPGRRECPPPRRGSGLMRPPRGRDRQQLWTQSQPARSRATQPRRSPNRTRAAKWHARMGGRLLLMKAS